MATPLVLRFGDLVIDLDHYRVLISNQPIILTYREYALLVYLAGRAGQVVHKRQLLEEGLGRHDPGGLRMVEEHIRHLKTRVERDGKVVIEEVEGRGYRFVSESRPQSTVHRPPLRRTVHRRQSTVHSKEKRFLHPWTVDRRPWTNLWTVDV